MTKSVGKLSSKFQRRINSTKKHCCYRLTPFGATLISTKSTEKALRVYQCIHKYAPHIPQFEKRWGIGDHSTFAEIHDALLRDGYASVYRLIPPTGRCNDEVFFTVWNYERLQRTWAREQGLAESDLDEIRLAQIKKFEPDVVYDFSSFVVPEFATKLRKRFSGPILCWNGFIKETEPPVGAAYDAYVSLHRPFVESWKQRGYPALELQPGIEPAWGTRPLRAFQERSQDLILYGQIGSHFSKRAELATAVAEAAQTNGYKFKCYAGASKRYYRPGGRLARMGVDLPFLVKWPPKPLRSFLSPSVFGAGLYEAIRGAKGVLNNFTDLSVDFHANMRIFETIGNGTPLLTPRGVYPDGLEANLDYVPFDSVEDISDIMRYLKSEPDAALSFAKNARTRALKNFSKEKQYEKFRDFVATL